MFSKNPSLSFNYWVYNIDEVRTELGINLSVAISPGN